MRLLPIACAISGLIAGSAETPVRAQAAEAAFGAPLADADLATLTGKFILPGGGSLALSVTSDTLVNGTPVLRTVLTVDRSAALQVFARDGSSAAPATGTGGGAGAGTPTLATGVSVLFDRRAGTQITLPTVSTVRGGPASETPAGLVPIAPVAGGAGVRTPDGLVSLVALPTGSQVTLAGDQIGIAHLVGSSVATAILNSGNDRTIDTVTTIGIDLRDAAALTLGSAALKVDALAADAARGMVR